MRAPRARSGALGPREGRRGVRGAASSKEDEGACRRHVTDESTPPRPSAALSGFPGEAFAWQGATREQPGGL